MQKVLKLFLKNLVVMSLLSTVVIFTAYFARRLMGSEFTSSMLYLWMAIGISSVGFALATTYAQLRKK